MAVENVGESSLAFMQAVMVISGHNPFSQPGSACAFSCWAECFGSRLCRKQRISEMWSTHQSWKRVIKRGKDVAKQVPDAQVRHGPAGQCLLHTALSCSFSCWCHSRGASWGEWTGNQVLWDQQSKLRWVLTSVGFEHELPYNAVLITAIQEMIHKSG